VDDLLADLSLAFGETFQMLSISTVLAIIGGLPLGFLIFVTDRNLFWQNRAVYLISSVLVNIIRSCLLSSCWFCCCR
jgi:D-methionine transport system permease protein